MDFYRRKQEVAQTEHSDSVRSRRLLRFRHKKRECSSFAFERWDCDGILEEKDRNPATFNL